MNDLTLNTLAQEINALHYSAEHHAGQAVVYAARCGQKLIEAKEACIHGQWLPWLEANSQVNQQQSNKYMNLAKGMPELLNSNHHHSGNLPSINAAIALLSAPEEVKQQAVEKQSAGEKVTLKNVNNWKAKVRDAEQLAVQAKNEAEKAKQSAEDFRQQYIVERNALRAAIKERDQATSKIQEIKSSGATDEQSAKRIRKLESEAHRLNEKIRKYNRESAKQPKIVSEQFNKGLAKGRELERTNINAESEVLITADLDELRNQRSQLKSELEILKSHDETTKGCYNAIEAIHCALLSISTPDCLMPKEMGVRRKQISSLLSNIQQMIGQIQSGCEISENQLIEYIERVEPSMDGS